MNLINALKIKFDIILIVKFNKLPVWRSPISPIIYLKWPWGLKEFFGQPSKVKMIYLFSIFSS